ncbi:uncharacterized protein [Cicer arietinum]|nr:G patch domain-containing protein 8 isoform X3 [Cicer arietinum]XP_004491423.1 G patch domain-containing protein 8 isoform X3 [Cicer arietinum]XP_004491424.1 G patch domain-containing protein 8 isoform X3 [Cicer arietinum]XP_012568682.1 G patch domain-containing protein 8 isoform X3 [Cicer arietinum]XP_012568683.1 G patch domain-containing protein 8 isoform X3 [Cicer arietinum]XP_012568685.1 G patch domain-containing protein 8 isoform X3 [Cicer arietinum]XP_012568686.1 G patch domain-conta
MFVSKHGSQSEIILRVKQGDNPTFGFLMPDHPIHPYFRFLVDHQELLKVDKDDGDSTLDKNRSQGLDQTGGALSLLGSVYGSGEDEDGTTESTSDLERNTHVGAVDTATTYASPGIEQAESSSDAIKKDRSISKNSIPLKEKVPVIKRNQSISNVKTATSAKAKTGDAPDSGSSGANKSQTFVPSTAKIELPVVEPPSDIKRVIERIVEFIVKNGRQFEAVLAEQDRAHGRFPFLLPSNRYHSYYLKVLQTAEEESKLPGKGYQKHNPAGRAGDTNTAVHEENDSLSIGSMDSDLPNDMDRKEKFKMIIGKSKKDGQDPTLKNSQSQTTISMDAAATAAILQAATRGIKNPKLEFFTKTSSGNGGNLSSSGSLHSSQLQGFVQHRNLNLEGRASVPVAKAIAETVAIAAAGEADSSEAHMTKEQKLKAERLKRAKMFAAMIKSGVGAFKSELPRALSVEPPGSGLSGSDAEVGNFAGKEREGSSVPFDADNSDKSHMSEAKLSDDNSDRSHKSEVKLAIDNNNERRSKRKYRSRSSKHEEEEEEEEVEENKEDIRDHKRSRKKHRSHRSSHRSRDRDADRERDRNKRKHKRRDSSSKDKYSYRESKHDSSSDDEHQHLRHHRKYDSSSDEKHHSSRRQHEHRHSQSPDCEHRHSRKHYSSSDDEEHRHRNRNTKHKSRSHAEREVELEEGEIVKSDKSQASELGRGSREASVGLSKSTKAPSQSPEVTDVSDELRAKIRAMLMANM